MTNVIEWVSHSIDMTLVQGMDANNNNYYSIIVIIITIIIVKITQINWHNHNPEIYGSNPICTIYNNNNSLIKNNIVCLPKIPI